MAPVSIKPQATVRRARATKQPTRKPMARVIHEALEESFGQYQLGDAAAEMTHHWQRWRPSQRLPNCIRTRAAALVAAQ